MLLRSWLSALPGPVAVAYEAGPTGFGLYRYLTAAGSAARWRSRRSCRSRQGQSRVQEAITKTGNGHARRLLVEAAWHHRSRHTAGKAVRNRWQLAPAAARIRGHDGNRRLHQRWVRFIQRRKPNAVANVAIARELAGWSWSLAVLDDE